MERRQHVRPAWRLECLTEWHALLGVHARHRAAYLAQPLVLGHDPLPAHQRFGCRPLLDDLPPCVLHPEIRGAQRFGAGDGLGAELPVLPGIGLHHLVDLRRRDRLARGHGRLELAIEAEVAEPPEIDAVLGRAVSAGLEHLTAIHPVDLVAEAVALGVGLEVEGFQLLAVVLDGLRLLAREAHHRLDIARHLDRVVTSRHAGDELVADGFFRVGFNLLDEPERVALQPIDETRVEPVELEGDRGELARVGGRERASRPYRVLHGIDHGGFRDRVGSRRNERDHPAHISGLERGCHGFEIDAALHLVEQVEESLGKSRFHLGRQPLDLRELIGVLGLGDDVARRDELVEVEHHQTLFRRPTMLITK